MESKWASSYPSTKTIKEVETFFKEEGFEKSFADMLKELMSHVKIENEKKQLLDFGCNNGIMLNYFKDYDLGLYGVDIDKKSIIEGHKLFPEFNLVKTDGLEIPFRDDYFDILFVSGVLWHIRHEDREKIYREFKRVARYLIAFEINAKEKSVKEEHDFIFYHTNFKEELARYFNCLHLIESKCSLIGLYEK